MPKVSVIIPAYNASQYLADAIRSVLSQSFRDFEIIVVDDGSSDNTEQVAAEFFPDVKYYRQSNAGPAIARNTGIRKAKGEWIAFLDSDDWWDETHLEQLLLRCGQVPEADMIYGSRCSVDAWGRVLEEPSEQSAYPEGWIFRDLLAGNYISTPSVMVKRTVLEILNGFGEDPVFRNCEDYDLWLRISAQFRIASIPGLVFYRRLHDKNATANSVGRIVGRVKAIENAASLIRADRVRPENRPELVNVHELMVGQYEEAAKSLFYFSEYSALRAIAQKAMRGKQASMKVILLYGLALLPATLIEEARRIRRLAS
jgi:glycosyltransferase involved in cell wall biosynthesis